MTTRRRQDGTAMIAAMLVAALAAGAGAVMIERQDFAIRRLESGRDYEQARWVLRGGTQWARSILAEDARSSSIDHPGELWATGLPATQIEQGTVAGEISDQQGLFNLRNLTRDGKTNPQQVATLRRLLAILGLPATLAEAIASQPIAELGDLYRVRGVDEATVSRLRAFVTVLPQPTPVNVNTAPPEVLAAIAGLDLTQARSLARTKNGTPFRDRDEFLARLPRSETPPGDGEIAVQSRYFLVAGHATVGRADVRMEALLERAAGALPTIVWQRIL
jgi:general secretion pathway protein K